MNETHDNDTPTPRHYGSVLEIRQANEAHGGHWFGKGEQRFFNSRWGDAVYGGRYFVTSEKCDDNHPRRYSIRTADARGRISTVDGFGNYASHAGAVRAIKRLLEKEQGAEKHG